MNSQVASIRRRINPASVFLGTVAIACLLVLAVAGVQAFVASVAVAGLAIVGLRQPLVPLAAVILTIPLQSELALSISNRSATWTKIAIVALLLSFAVRFLVGISRLEMTGIGFAYCAVVLTLAASFYNAVDREAWAGEVYRWLIAFAVYLVAVDATNEPRFAPAVLGATAISVIGASVGGIYQALAGVGPQTFQARGLTRAYSAFGEPNPFAGYLEMTVPLLIAVSLAWLVPSLGNAKPPAPWFVGLVAGGVAFGSLAILLSQSRGGLLGFAAGVVTILLFAGGWPRLVAVSVVALIMLLIVVSPLRPIVRDRIVASIGDPSASTLVTSKNWAAQERMSHWRAGLNMWSEYPVLGVGAGNYNDHYRQETQIWRFRIPRGHAHSNFIQAAAHSGALGLMAYLALVTSVLVTLVRKLAQSDLESRAIVVGALAVTVAVIVHGIFDYLHVLSLGLQLSVVWAAVEIGGKPLGPRWPRHEATACQP